VAESVGKSPREPEASREAAALHQEAATARANSLSSASRLLEVEEVLAQSKARIFALEEALDVRAELVDELHQKIERADRIIAAMKASVSWRITAPLRALKQRH
jgi:hypothetical protein